MAACIALFEVQVVGEVYVTVEVHLPFYDD